MQPIVKNLSRLVFMRQEAYRVAGPSPELFGYIRRHGLDTETCLAHADIINVALVRFLSGAPGDETFVFDVDGEPAAVIEALLFDDYRQQVCADLVAWPLDAPELFATAMGRNDGADVLGPQNMIQRHGAPLQVYRTPLAWLQAGCEGCVPLKPGARNWLAHAAGPFLVEDIEHGHEIRVLLGPAARSHRILIKNLPARKAA
ncbi:hypothetical protein [Aestuariivirga sp.]|uniref:hypothetical protein n=1 Tax=Aestuariivirga sp. TaxID=2650926 RepID=UPI00391A2F33